MARGFARGLAGDADRALLTLELLTLAQRVPQIKVCFTEHHARFAEQLRVLLLEIAGDGADAERRAGSAAAGLAALVDGLVLHWTLSDTGFDLEARLLDAVSALVRGLR
ncbi:TetR family transcriptional regulator C-terminal domain-containing protein [Actinomadura sp. NAK00032]|uniref:TetR family transcriptional regulator C-terminal domain-containing protein n=1 Tax=Actinomadura sp. NAK00032 TaxID=2742128 RepID=UPI0020C76170|nr:TetR family transcriptional regulator C-terminal domain-containing protein [Actinomadura sp. NAK00032]